MAVDEPKPVEWIGSRRADLRALPEDVQDTIGYALYQAQVGLGHRDVKPLCGLGSNVLEVISRYDGDAFRAVYTVRFRGCRLCAACLPEEAQARHRHPEIGERLDKTSTQGSGETLPGELWWRVER